MCGCRLFVDECRSTVADIRVSFPNGRDAVQVSISPVCRSGEASVAGNVAASRERALCRVVRDLALPFVPGEADLLDAAGGVVDGLVAAAAADHRDFFFEGGEPIGQVEAGAGRFLGQAGDFLLRAR